MTIGNLLLCIISFSHILSYNLLIEDRFLHIQGQNLKNFIEVWGPQRHLKRLKYISVGDLVGKVPDVNYSLSPTYTCNEPKGQQHGT